MKTDDRVLVHGAHELAGRVSLHLLEVESLEVELRLDDARGLDPGPEDVLLGGHVVRGGDSVELIQVERGRIVQLIFSRPLEAVLHSGVKPEPLHQLADLVRQFHLVSLSGHLEEEPRVLLKDRESLFTVCSQDSCAVTTVHA